MDVDVVEDFLCTQVQVLHRRRLEDQLCGLADEELANREELLPCELLVPVVNLAWRVGQAGNLEQLSCVGDVRGAVQALLVKRNDLAGRLALLPHALV
eukprot:CAMPEP_0185572682 /NCGR_PEP_ID=MMETSP0434-20130131/4569_1 /TAXON_ID=626734 ORGANISM="Favella taraikaensis, Strain Fe Narragansett Bay" /NCGR_SAMPLE_ID=MMETSP0434 /ASSEMBLY_ACC=CAM_ASM_000379 /LENGTH=97 /DNA_ID=CAMNT_0028188645 /DNA_START=1133 /DNA_END=1426 /DNA_ORIENTATION=-